MTPTPCFGGQPFTLVSVEFSIIICRCPSFFKISAEKSQFSVEIEIFKPDFFSFQNKLSKLLTFRLTFQGCITTVFLAENLHGRLLPFQNRNGRPYPDWNYNFILIDLFLVNRKRLTRRTLEFTKQLPLQRWVKSPKYYIHEEIKISLW